MKSLRWSLIAVTCGIPLMVTSPTITIAQLATNGMPIGREHAALITTDWQDEFLGRGVVSARTGVDKSGAKNNRLGRFGTLLKEDRQHAFASFVSLRYDLRKDRSSKSERGLNVPPQDSEIVDRKVVLRFQDSKGTGAHWLRRQIPFLEEVKNLIAKPHLSARDFTGDSNSDLIFGMRGDSYIRLEWELSF